MQVSGGNHGRCAIPTGATAISINITAVGASDPTFVAAYPADVVNPGTSSLNVVPGASPTPNEVDVQLSSDGAITLFNAHGTVDVIGDITGYYVAARIDDVESAVAALDGRLANVEDALGDVNTGLAATDATLSDIDGRLAATDATLSDIDGRLGAVESTPVSKTFEWHYQGTVTQAGGPTSIMSIPAGSTVTPSTATSPSLRTRGLQHGNGGHHPARRRHAVDFDGDAERIPLQHVGHHTNTRWQLGATHDLRYLQHRDGNHGGVLVWARGLTRVPDRAGSRRVRLTDRRSNSLWAVRRSRFDRAVDQCAGGAGDQTWPAASWLT